MEFIERSRGTYRPIRVLFDTPIYERALQICWHLASYKVQIALVAELLRLQQKNQLPSEVTVEDVTDLLVEESKNTLRVQLWEFELEDFDEVDAKPLLKLVWEVNTSMKMRDVEFEARRLLNSPQAIPPQLQHPQIISQAQKYARSLTEQQQGALSSKVLGPREVVMEVVPKVLQGFWLPPKNTSFNMPSQQLSKMAVGVTKAVEDRVCAALSTMLQQVTLSRSSRDDMVLSIQEKVRQGYTQDVLVRKLNCFAAEVLNTIGDVAAGEICALFQPQTHTEGIASNSEKDCIQPADVVDDAGAETTSAEDVNEEPRLEEDIGEKDTDIITPPAAPLTTSAEPPANMDEAEEQSVPSSEPDSVEVPAPPALQALTDKPVITAVQDEPTPSGEPQSNITVSHQPTPSPEPDSAVVSTPSPPVTSADVAPVITAVQDESTSSAEPPANVPIHDGLNKQEEADEQPAPGPEPSCAVTSPPPVPLTPPAEPAANIGSLKTEEQPAPGPGADPAVVSTPPPLVVPADEPPVTSAVQDELIITEQPGEVDECFSTTTEVKKTKSSRVSSFFTWLKKSICCCFLPEDDTETE